MPAPISYTESGFRTLHVVSIASPMKQTTRTEVCAMNIMLIGVNDELRNSLEPVLHSLDSVPGRENAFDVIFCGAEAGLIDRVRRSNPEARIVAVSRLAETERWLDAIEAGAD